MICRRRGLGRYDAVFSSMLVYLYILRYVPNLHTTNSGKLTIGTYHLTNSNYIPSKWTAVLLLCSYMDLVN
jgi:hypothetical protein